MTHAIITKLLTLFVFSSWGASVEHDDDDDVLINVSADGDP